MIGLQDSVRACPFDLDGVLTLTATVRAAARKEKSDGSWREHGANIVVSHLFELLED